MPNNIGIGCCLAGSLLLHDKLGDAAETAGLSDRIIGWNLSSSKVNEHLFKSGLTNRVIFNLKGSFVFF